MWCLLGLGLLLLTQMRLHYFGSFAMYLPWLVVAQACLVHWQQQTKVILLSVGLVSCSLTGCPRDSLEAWVTPLEMEVSAP